MGGPGLHDDWQFLVSDRVIKTLKTCRIVQCESVDERDRENRDEQTAESSIAEIL